MSQIYGTLDETPIAQRALSEDRVVEVGGLDGEVPGALHRLRGLLDDELHPGLRRRALARA